jgi:putative acetyltransferase
MFLRKIEERDNEAIAAIVKNVMTEFKADPKTTILGDPRLMTMYQNYQDAGAAYYVAELNGKIIGGAGIKRLDGSEETDRVCELQRMFLLSEARGKGLGKALMVRCIEDAKKLGYRTIYLESLSNMHQALALYRSFGFKETDGPLGNTGHGGCDVNMTLDIG